MANMASTDIVTKEVIMTLAEFFEAASPSHLTKISDLSKEGFYNGVSQGFRLLTPDIQLHCPNDACNGLRFFRCVDKSRPVISDDGFSFFYVSYICSNCQKSDKIYSLAAQREPKSPSGECYKFGELPAFGPPTPARLISLIGPDRDLFLQGRRCENQGLGIGAFVYYRRVVENQKNRILDEIIKVSTKLSAPAEMVRHLEAAKAETQFSKALSSVKDAIPQALLINGHNPLTLLHSALSDGLHDKSDDTCLEIASSVRIVLSELSERLAQALKDEAGLNNALTRLMAAKTK